MTARGGWQSPARWLALSLTVLGFAASANPASQFEFIYIDANEGTASGGHAAIRFDQQIFHFQYQEPGWLRLHRDDFNAFRFAYGFQENRRIHGVRIAVGDAFLQTLQAQFNHRLQIENQQMSWLQSLYDNLTLINSLQQPDTAAKLPLKGLGYFLSDYRPTAETRPIPHSAASRSTSLASLRQAVNQRYGDRFLSDQQQQTWQDLQALQPTLPANPDGQAETDRFNSIEPSFAQRYQHLLLSLAAIDVLQAEQPPLPSGLLTLPATEFTLSPVQLDKLQQFRQRLFHDLIELFRSPRSDRGFPLLVGMARLHALDASLATGRLTILDRRSQTTEADPASRVDPVDLPAALQYTEHVLRTAATRLFEAEPLDERGYADIERSATAWLQLHRQGNSADLSLPTLTLSPTRPAATEPVPLPLNQAVLAEFRQAVENQLAAYQAQLSTLYGYQLLQRNCVTELFRMLNQTVETLATPGETLSTASRRLLGGYLEEQGWNRIPFVAYEAMADEYRTIDRYRLTTYREQQRQQRYRQAPAWQVDLQESNVLSSTIYRGNDTDAAFLFFTQDEIWSRPLLGSFNLAVASGQEIFGLLSWPWDGGQQLQKGLKGLFVSLPELLFCNIRKGSFPQLLPMISQGESGVSVRDEAVER